MQFNHVPRHPHPFSVDPVFPFPFPKQARTSHANALSAGMQVVRIFPFAIPSFASIPLCVLRVCSYDPRVRQASMATVLVGLSFFTPDFCLPVRLIVWESLWPPLAFSPSSLRSDSSHIPWRKPGDSDYSRHPASLLSFFPLSLFFFFESTSHLTKISIRNPTGKPFTRPL